MTNDPELYAKMSEPFKSADDANSAIRGFFADLGELRKKHHMANVTVIVNVRTRYGDGNICDALSWAHHGDSLRAESMLAYALGQAQAEHRETIGKLLAGKGMEK